MIKVDKSTKETLENGFGKDKYEQFVGIYQTTVKKIKEDTSKTKNRKAVKQND